MRGGRPHAGLGLADLVDDQRHAGLERLLGRAAERAGALHVLQQHQDRAGLALIEDELGEVERLEARLVACRNDIAERQLLGPPVVEEREADAPALGDDRQLSALAALGQQRPPGGLHRRAEGGTQRRRGVGEALRVGAHDRHAMCPRHRAHLLLQPLTIAAGRLRETRAQHHCGTDARLAASLQLCRYVLGRDDQDGQVGRFRQVGHGGVGLEPHNVGVASADGIEAACEGVRLHNQQDAPTQALRVGRRTDQRDRSRPQQPARDPPVAPYLSSPSLGRAPACTRPSSVMIEFARSSQAARSRCRTLAHALHVEACPAAGVAKTKNGCASITATGHGRERRPTAARVVLVRLVPSAMS